MFPLAQRFPLTPALSPEAGEWEKSGYSLSPASGEEGQQVRETLRQRKRLGRRDFGELFERDC